MSKEGDKTWDYCKPIIDYDKCRETNQFELNVLTVEARKINDELSRIITEAEAVIKEFQGVRLGQAELDKQILQLIKSKKALDYNLNTCIYNLEKKWVIAEQQAITIGKDLDKAELQSLKKLELSSPAPAAPGSDAAESSTKSFHPTDADYMQRQEKLFNRKINELIEMRAKIDTVNCRGMEDYDHDLLGKGLKGEYFDNEGWMGKGRQRIDGKIDFDWKGASPIQGINPYNFSIRWQGYLKAPFTGVYKFLADSDDSTMITFNNEVIIGLNMKTATPESQSRNTIWLNQEKYIVQHPSVIRSKAYSRDVYLVGGTKYK